VNARNSLTGRRGSGNKGRWIAKEENGPKTKAGFTGVVADLAKEPYDVTNILRSRVVTKGG